MKAFKQIDRQVIFFKSIKNSNTGTPEEFACKLGICKSTLSTYIEYWKSIGAKIFYNHNQKSYQFEPGFEVQIAFCINFRDNGVSNTIFGDRNNSRFS